MSDKPFTLIPRTKLTEEDKKEILERLEGARGYLLFVINADKNFDWSGSVSDVDGVYMANYYLHDVFNGDEE